MKLDAPIFDNPPRAILIIARDGKVRFENSAYRLLIATLRSWKWYLSDESVAPRAEHIRQIFDQIDPLPVVGKLKGAATINACFNELQCTLGVRQAQLSNEELGLAVYWRRYANTELSHLVIQSGLIVNSLLNSQQPQNAVSHSTKVTISLFNAMAQMLLTLDRPAEIPDAYDSIRENLAVQFSALSKHLHRHLSHSLPQASQQQELKQIIFTLDQLHQYLNTMSNSQKDIESELAILNGRHDRLTGKALQSDILAQVVWLESAKAGDSNTIAHLSQSLSQFARKGLSTIDSMNKPNSPIIDHGLVSQTIQILEKLRHVIAQQIRNELKLESS